jgi:predicted small metal-binding protein
MVLTEGKHAACPWAPLLRQFTIIKDLGLPCDYEMKAEGEMELMKRIEGHVKTVHQMDVSRQETRQKVLKVFTLKIRNPGRKKPEGLARHQRIGMAIPEPDGWLSGDEQ